MALAADVAATVVVFGFSYAAATRASTTPTGASRRRDRAVLRLRRDRRRVSTRAALVCARCVALWARAAHLELGARLDRARARGLALRRPARAAGPRLLARELRRHPLAARRSGLPRLPAARGPRSAPARGRSAALDVLARRVRARRIGSSSRRRRAPALPPRRPAAGRDPRRRASGPGRAIRTTWARSASGGPLASSALAAEPASSGGRSLGAVAIIADVPLREPADGRDAHARAPAGLRGLRAIDVARDPLAAAARGALKPSDSEEPSHALPSRRLPGSPDRRSRSATSPPATATSTTATTSTCTAVATSSSSSPGWASTRTSACRTRSRW